MTAWESGYVEANGIRLHYTRTGMDRPPIVLAHGFSDDGLCWTPLAKALAPDFDVIMVDARGHGRSDDPAQGYGPTDHAADLTGVIRALGLRKPAILGHSMGAMTTLTLATIEPAMPSMILLEDPPPWWMPQTAEEAADGEQRWAGMSAWARSLKRKARAELMAEERTTNPGWSEDEIGPWADAKHRLSLNVLSRSAQIAIDWPTLLPKISCPVLLITADPARGAIVTPDHADVLRRSVPQLQVAHIANAGHSIRRDQFERYLATVRAALQSA